MAKAKDREGSTHDRKVRELARQLKKEGYSVKAAGVRGYKVPTPIGKGRRIPDVEAAKGTIRKIIEVETPTSISAHKDQLKTFVKHAAQKKGTQFEVVVTKPRRTQPKSSTKE